jgi:hypothetical protein
LTPAVDFGRFAAAHVTGILDIHPSSLPASMPPIDAKLIFAVIGPLFLLLAAVQWWRDGALRPKGRAWFRIGLIFSAVAVWLWWSAPT